MDLKVEHQALEMLLELLQDLMARDVLTRLKWWRRLSMMMLSSVTIAMTRDVTPLMSPTTSLNRRRTVKRTSEKPVSLNMSRLLSMRQSRSADNLLSRIVIPLERRSVELNMSLNVGPSRRFMMLSAELRLKRNVRMRHLATPPTPSAPSGPRRFAVSPRSQSRSTLPSLDVPRNLLNCVPLLAVDSSRDQRSVMTKSKLLFKMLPRKTVTLSPRELVSMLPSLFQS